MNKSAVDPAIQGRAKAFLQRMHDIMSCPRLQKKLAAMEFMDHDLALWTMRLNQVWKPQKRKETKREEGKADTELIDPLTT